MSPLTLQVPPEIFLPLAMLLAPIAGGALRLRISERSLSLVAKVGSVLVGVYPSMILFNELAESLDVVGAKYAQMMLGFGVASVCVSWLLVSFGEWVGREDGIRISNGLDLISEEVKGHFLPLLDSFNSNIGRQTSLLRSEIDQFKKDITDAFNSKVKQIEVQNKEISSKMDELFARYAEDARNYGIMVNGYNSFQKSFRTLLDEYHKDIESMKRLQEDLANRIEIYDKLKQFQVERESDLDRREKVLSAREGNLSTQSQLTTLTRDDGRASRDIGEKTEEEFASMFRDAGFGVERRKAQGDPDITLSSSDVSRIVAVVNAKSYMLYDEPKRNQRRISPEDIIPETVASQKHKVSVVIAVKNRSNGRKWLCLIPFDQLTNWKGVSTPVMLSKKDPESGNELKEMFRRLLRQLGGKA
ncbi:MAG: hypothetical protein JRN52_05115 [Nitrososphaerota archaeon]|nr:hypothetical protein [Nitrososphaerota archaeon]